jgi:hypothetical protein
MGSRCKTDIECKPMRGDVIEIKEWIDDEATGTHFEHETMLRVVAVHEDRIWFKEYGEKGHQLTTCIAWSNRLEKSPFTVVQFGDQLGC